MNNKWIKNIFLVGLILLLAVTFVACVSTDDDKENERQEKKVVGLQIDQNTIPTTNYAQSVDLSQIKAIVYYNVGTKETIPLTLDMIALEDREKLNNFGTWSLKVAYEGVSTKFNIEIGKPVTIRYTLSLTNGYPCELNGVTLDKEPDVEEGTEKEYIYDKGSVVKVKALDITNYNFKFWSDFGQEIDRNIVTTVVMNGEHDYEASYTERVNEVSFVLNGADKKSMSSINVNLIEENDLEKLTRLNSETQYVFDGWTTDSQAIGEDAINYSGRKISFPYEVKMDTILYATWRPLGLNYALVGQDEYEVTGYELSQFDSNSNLSDIPTKLEIPAYFNDGGSIGSIVGISATAFSNLSNGLNLASFLTEISIPYSVNDIEYGAFSSCLNLKNIIVSDDNTYYKSINNVLYTANEKELVAYPSNKVSASYNLADTTEVIGKLAFKDAVVGSLNLPNSVKNIGEGAFDSVHIDSLIFNDINSNSVVIDENCFNDNITSLLVNQSYIDGYKNKLVSLESKIISDETLIAEIGTDSAKSILFRTISNPYSLHSGETIEIIGADRGLVKYVVPTKINSKYVSSIGAKAFSNSVFLADVVVTKGELNRILPNAFENTPFLKKTLENNNDEIVFNNILYNYLGEKSSFVVKNGITMIGEGAFLNNKNLESVDYSKCNTLKIISAYAFAGCENLAGDLALTMDLNNILDYAFSGVNYGTAFMNVENIASYAFENCTKIVSFRMTNKLKSLSTTSFYNCISNEYFEINDSMYFEAINGILYQSSTENGDMDTLFAYPSGKLNGVFDINKPSQDVTLSISKIVDYAFYWSNIGALYIPTSVTNITSNSIIVPGLQYVEFEDITNTMTYDSIFASEDESFHPNYVVVSDSNKASFVNGADIIVKNAPNTIFDYGADFVYAYNTEQADKLFLVRASRVQKSIVIPEDIDGKFLSSVEEFAFVGEYLTSLTMNSKMSILANNSLKYLVSLEELRLEHCVNVLEKDEDTFSNSFNNGLLIYIDSSLLASYKENWVNSEKYFIYTTQPVATFDYKTGEEPDSDVEDFADVMGEITEIPQPTRLGFEFLGWAESGYAEDIISAPFVVSHNMKLLAVWKPTKYKVSFILENNATIANDTIEVAYGELFQFDTPVLANKVFLHWIDVDKNIYSANYVWDKYLSKGRISLYPVWKDKEFTINYSEGGFLPKKVVYGEKLSLSVYSKQGFTFKGWTLDIIEEGVEPLLLTDENGAGLLLWSHNSQEEYTVYPYMVGNEVELTLKLANDVVYDTVKVPFGANYVFKYDASKVAGYQNQIEYTFAGWYDVDGNRFTFDDGRSLQEWNSPVDTLYAKWAVVVGNSNIDALINMSDYSENFVLSENITISKPIGSLVNKYYGVFNGNGKTVTFDYMIDDTSDLTNFDGYVGMFAYNEGIIKNVNVTANISINIEDIDKELFVGAVAGVNDGEIRDDVVVHASISVDFATNSYNSSIGGIVGVNGLSNNNAKISNLKMGSIIQLNITTNDAPFAGNNENTKVGIVVGDFIAGVITSDNAVNYNEGDDDYFTLSGIVKYGQKTEDVNVDININVI